MKRNGKANKTDLPQPSPEGKQDIPKDEPNEEISRVVGRKDEYGLTIQQRMFCDLYIQSPDHNATQCYIEAYPNVTDRDVAQACSSRLLSYAMVKNYLVLKTKGLAEKVEMDQEWCFRNLKVAVERCLMLEEIRTSEGDVVGMKFDAAGVFKGTELIMRHLGLFAADKRIDVTTNGQNIATLIAVPPFADDDDNVSESELGKNGNGRHH